MSTSVLSLRLPDDLKDRLDRLSAQTGRPASFHVRQALTERLDHLEDMYALAARAEAARSGQATTFSLAEVAHDLGITLGPVSDDVLEDLH
ncbi:ribbon-helix-helix protein, CopG family [Actinomyces lilanjuaniae]|uniref:Ribbon-helix-helix protein, CopG family n=1 Tax=Actinomyces lilanjuaniae TaxID=2321394 RepID=A0ABN5PQE5_9ACTO|nr:ribbon-helix-helix domain-containing protein [Actinomyces lilanjuaniae]AYD90615.1 ribbon-helix-helix protein, CopG family [Actinomyces lilanjuaniae]